MAKIETTTCDMCGERIEGHQGLVEMCVEPSIKNDCPSRKWPSFIIRIEPTVDGFEDVCGKCRRNIIQRAAESIKGV